jgi:lincosamide and streptogramin A transport system ATP-binding/permease protein
VQNLSFEIQRGERIALEGANGSGKSSIIKLLWGIGNGDVNLSIPHTGTFRLAGGLKISYVPQGTGHLRGTLRKYAEAEGADYTLLLAILRNLGLEREQFEKNLQDQSEGQRKKVLIAASLAEEAHLYLWDEPLNYIDLLSRIQIENLLLKYAPTLLFVEHDTTFREKIATRTISL